MQTEDIAETMQDFVLVPAKDGKGVSRRTANRKLERMIQDIRSADLSALVRGLDELEEEVGSVVTIAEAISKNLRLVSAEAGLIRNVEAGDLSAKRTLRQAIKRQDPPVKRFRKFFDEVNEVVSTRASRALMASAGLEAMAIRLGEKVKRVMADSDPVSDLALGSVRDAGDIASNLSVSSPATTARAMEVISAGENLGAALKEVRSAAAACASVPSVMISTFAASMRLHRAGYERWQDRIMTSINSAEARSSTKREAVSISLANLHLEAAVGQHLKKIDEISQSAQIALDRIREARKVAEAAG